MVRSVQGYSEELSNVLLNSPPLLLLILRQIVAKVAQHLGSLPFANQHIDTAWLPFWFNRSQS